MPNRPITLETLLHLLRTLLRLPPAWFRTVLVLAILSIFDLTWTSQAGLSIQMQVSNTTVLILAFMWLPAVLQLFALVGGAIRAPGAEFSSPGLEQLLQAVMPEAQDEVMGAVKVVLEDVKETASPQHRQELQQVERQLDEQYEDLTPVEARQALQHLARRYQALQDGPRGVRRNFLMETVAAAMQSLVPPAKISDVEIQNYLQSSEHGDRLIGLACVMDQQGIGHFEPVLNAIAHSGSAFEQLHALRIMERMLPTLPTEHRDCLRQVLNQQRDYDEQQGQWIRPDSDRWLVSEKLLAAIG
ncbi:MAG: hypothetical protein F6J87_00070 [Spirulina sp. SIO3F2]|nr:hypothetical protein [Spirulina sp. SIO3F2]